ncbi:NAD(P)/FAD-dependent oxidoreductase [soil metagenome]
MAKGKLAAVAAVAGGVAALKAYKEAQAPEPLRTHYLDAPTKVLIVGGGFGGLAAAEGLVRELEGKSQVGVALLDETNYTTFYPMVPRAISSNVEVRHLAHPLRNIVEPLGMQFFQAIVEGIDFNAREVKTEHGAFPYDYLVLAPGSRTAFFDTPGVVDHAIDFKGLREALHIRNRIIDCVEEAEWRRGDYEDDLLTFVFVGGGPTGVEGAAYSHDLIFEVLKDSYPNVDFDRAKVILVNSGDRILKDLDVPLANAATARFDAQNIELVNNTRVAEIHPDHVLLSTGRQIPTRTTVWATGVEPGPLVKDLDVPKDNRGRILVDEFLRVRDRPGVYAVGDCVNIDYDGPPVPALAQSAEQEGEKAGYNVAVDISGGSHAKFVYKSLGNLVDLGSTSSLADVLGVKLTGTLGELVWRMVYLKELGHNLNRAQVISDWVVDFFIQPNISKLMEEE